MIGMVKGNTSSLSSETSMAENQNQVKVGGVPPRNPKMKTRPIVRIGIFLISHSVLVSLICFTAGVVILFLLPVLAKNTYISENALMPGSANPMFSGQDTVESNRLVKDIMSLKRTAGETRLEIRKLLAQHMEATGAEVYEHKFHAQMNQFRPLQFFSASPNAWNLQENTSFASYGVNSIGIIRAPRGDGKEAIVLVSPYNSSNTKLSEALSLALAYSIFNLLSRANWLAKDVIWLAADTHNGEYSSVAAWLSDYHTPVFVSSKELDTETCPENNVLRNCKENADADRKVNNVFRRAGTMAAALVLKVVDRQEATDKDTLTIYSEAANGQMPNLDLINVVHYLAVHRQGLHVKVKKMYSLLSSGWLKVVGELLELISNVALSLNPQWKFGLSATDYVEATATLASSMYHQALGIPTGLHGAFRDYQVDAITLEISSKVSLYNEARRSEFFLRSGRLMEGVVRSVNNLLEKFHQSFFLYLLTSSSKFVSVGVYMIAFGLLVVPLPVAAAALYSSVQKLESSPTTGSPKTDATPAEAYGTTLKAWRWIHAAKVVFVVHLWGVMVALAPSLIIQFPERTPNTSMLAWTSFSVLSLVTLHAIMASPYSKTSCCHSREWAMLKAVVIAVVSIGLGLMSIINFATAQIGAMLLVPLCLLARPFKINERGKLMTLTLRIVNILLALINCPPAMLLLLKGYSEGFSSVSGGDFWIWAESLWAWNSATYLYLVLIHVPCWVLCIHILIHPS